MGEEGSGLERTHLAGEHRASRGGNAKCYDAEGRERELNIPGIAFYANRLGLHEPVPRQSNRAKHFSAVFNRHNHKGGHSRGQFRTLGGSRFNGDRPHDPL